MAKKGTGWNSLSTSQQNAFKKKNFFNVKNSAGLPVNVSEKTIQGLRAGKTFEGNVKKFKASGMNAEQRQAMNRFYGQARVDAAFGKWTGSAYKPSSSPAPQVNKTTSNSFSSSAIRQGSGGMSNVANANIKPSTRPAYPGITNSAANRNNSFYGNPKKGYSYATPAANRKVAQGAVWDMVGKKPGESVKHYMTTPGDFSVAGAYRAATGQKAKYGNERAGHNALNTLMGASVAGAVRGAIAKAILKRGATKPLQIAARKKFVDTSLRQIEGPKKAITAGPRKQITAGPPKAIGSGPKGRALAEGTRDYERFSTAASKSAEALKKAKANVRRNLLSPGELAQVQKTHDLNVIGRQIAANKLRVANGMKPMPVKMGKTFKAPTTKRLTAAEKPAGSGATKPSALPAKAPKTTPKSPKTAKKVSTPKQRQKAHNESAKAQTRALGTNTKRGSMNETTTSRLSAQDRTVNLRNRMNAQLEKKGPEFRQGLRTRGAGGTNTPARNWEVKVEKKFGGAPSGQAVTAASKRAAKSGVDVTVGKSKTVVNAARRSKAAATKATAKRSAATKKAAVKKGKK